MTESTPIAAAPAEEPEGLDPEDYGLTGAGADLFRQVTKDYDFRPDELATLRMACQTLTLAERLEAELVAAPTVVLGSQRQPVANPLFGEVRQQRMAFSALVHRLAIPDLEEEGDDRMMARARSMSARKAARARWGTGRA